MKKFVLNIILLLTPFAIVIVTTNYVIDAGNVFASELYEKQISDILVKNHNAQGLGYFNERIVVKNIVTAIDTMPNVVAIGTSKVLGVRASMFPNTSFRNLGMTKSNMNDIIAEIGLFDSLKKFPKVLYIETNPLTKATKEDGDDWIPLHAYHKNSCNKLQLIQVDVINHPAYYFNKRKFRALVSLDYFQRCIFLKNKWQKQTVKDVDNAEMSVYGRYADGAICYAKNVKQVDTIKTMANASIFMNNMDLPIVDNNKLINLKKLIQYCKNKGVTVKLLTIPMQHDCYNFVNNKGNLAVIFSNAVLQLAKELNVASIGTINPYEIQLLRKNFYDYTHSDYEANQKNLQIIQYNPQ